jgi:hypothetical protein
MTQDIMNSKTSLMDDESDCITGNPEQVTERFERFTCKRKIKKIKVYIKFWEL